MSIKDDIKGETPETQTEPDAGAEPGVEDITFEEKSTLQRLLEAESPNKTLESYQEHPLNYDKRNSTGRILRGSEGILGDLNRAVLDIAIGILQKIWEYMGEGE